MSQELGSQIPLPAPQTTGGMPLMDALSLRESKRDFANKAIPPQILANLLWSALGVTRKDSGKLTVPNGRSRREIDCFIITAEGTYKYAIDEHALQVVSNDDLRNLAGKQDFVPNAPVNLIFVADYRKMPELSKEQQLVYGSTDAAFCIQNAYLYCTSEGLSTVARGSVDREALGAALGLDAQQRIILAQSVGYPA